VKERLLAAIKIDPETGCWNWQRSVRGGRDGRRYGLISVKGECRSTHRTSYETFVGPIPEGLFVLHHCDNGFCINPKHLFVGTHQDNVNDQVSKLRHMHGSNNGRAKLTPAQVKRIKASKLSVKELSLKYKMSKPQIYKIRAQTSWVHY
jgi:hypothetical protein